MHIRDRIKELRRVPARELIAHAHNWRTHPQAQRDALRGVLEEVGWADAALAYETPAGLQLIDGHLRTDVAPDAEIPVLVLDVTAAEARKILLTHDPIAAMAHADEERLRELVAEFETDNEALLTMVEDLLPPLPPTDGQTDPDAIPDPPDAAVTQPGDLWRLGNHRLLCGDSARAMDVDRLLADAPVHLVNTDPPYNVNVEPRSNNAIAAGNSSFRRTHHQDLDVQRYPAKAIPTGQLRPRDRALENDFISDVAFDELLGKWFGNLARVLLPGHGFYIWGGYSNVSNYPPAIAAAGLFLAQILVWDKEHPVLTRKDFMGAHESAFYGWKKGAAHRFFGPPNIPDLWSVKKVNPQSMVHLTEKPVELAVRALEYSSRRGENVLDLFGGSGSTLIAAEQTERRAFLMELDPLYCDVIVGRFEAFTGRQAAREPRP